jgi:uncharacterized membrane protein YccC
MTPMTFLGIILLVGGAFVAFFVWLGWVSGGSERRLHRATKLQSEAAARYTKAMEQEADAWRTAAETEKSATAAREREAKAAEDIAASLRKMKDEEKTDFFGKIFGARTPHNRSRSQNKSDHGRN